MTEWLFGPGSMMWKINKESVLLLGGRAALLMQLAHPLVAAGVADHSDFPNGAIARLRRTLDTMLSIVFGDMDTASQTAMRVNAMHERVVGTATDGTPYSARDPHLMLWVHATLVDSSIRVYEACVSPLSERELASYYEETKVVADLFGIPGPLVPDTLEDLRAWMDEMVASGEVVVTPLARELADAILRPMRFFPTRLATRAAVIEASLLPRPIRDGYGLRAGRPASTVMAMGRRATRMMLPLVPSPLRMLPAARSAHRRSA